MSNVLAQLVLARRGPDDEWMNLLFLVVVAVLYGLGAVVKAMKARSQSDEKPPQPSGQKPPSRDRAIQEISRQPRRPAGSPQHPAQPAGAPPKRTTLADLRAAARKFAAEAEQAFQTRTPDRAPKPPAAPPAAPAPTPEIQRQPAPILEPAAPDVKGLTGRRDTTAQAPPAHQLSDLLTDYTDPDKLRKAILHYEILGPPLSLRD